MNNFPLVILVAIIIYRLFTIKKQVLRIVAYIFILNLPKFINFENMWSNSVVDIKVYLLIIFTIILLYIINKQLIKREENKLYSNYSEMKLNKLIKENKIAKQKLNYEYEGIAKDIEFYLQLNLNTRIDMEIVMYDIFNMLIEGQEREEIPVDIIGVNIKEFCDDVIESYQKSNFKDKIIEIVYNSFLAIAAYILSGIIFSKIFRNTAVDMSMLILYIAPIGMLLMLKVILKRKIEPENSKNIKLLIVSLSFIIAGIVGFIIYKFADDWYIKFKIDYLAFTTVAIIFIILWVISYNDINNKIGKIIN